MTGPTPIRTRGRLPWRPVVAVAALVVLGPLAVIFLIGGDGGGPTVHRFVIPAGTRDQLDAGGEVAIVPPRMEVRVGDRLVLRNRDDVAHHMGPLVVDGGSVLRMTFAEVGTIAGVCTLNDEGESVIVVRG